MKVIYNFYSFRVSYHSQHTRTIGEREYQIREVRYDGNIHKIDEETELSEEEVSCLEIFVESLIILGINNKFVGVSTQIPKLIFLLFQITQFLEEWSSLWVPSSTDSCVVHYSFLVKYRECDRINKTNEIR